MPIRLTLTRAGKVLLARTIEPRSLETRTDQIGHAAQLVYADASQAGHDVIGTTLDVIEVEDRASDLLAKADAAVRRKATRDPRS